MSERPAERPPRYRLYGVTLASDHPFRNPLPPARGAADLHFHCTDAPPEAGWQRRPPAYQTPFDPEVGVRVLRYHRGDGFDVLRLGNEADHYLWDERIHCHLRIPEHRYLVEVQLLGLVMALWLERGGVPVLHGSAVRVGKQAVAFLASSGGGKSTLAASFVGAGHPLLGDDLLPLEITAGRVLLRPGYPQMRLWPEQAARFVPRAEELERFHPGFRKRRVPVGAGAFGSFCAETTPLARCYLPRLTDDPAARPEVRPLSPSEALLELLGASFAPRTVEALGWQPARLPLLAQVARAVPLRRLWVPRGLQHMPAVIDAVRADLEDAPEEDPEDDPKVDPEDDREGVSVGPDGEAG